MKCNKCGIDIQSDNIFICPRCGNFLQNQNDVIQVTDKKKNKKNNKDLLIIFLSIIVWGAALVVFFIVSNFSFYFSEEENSDVNEYGNTNNVSIGDGETRIVYDKVYEKQSIGSKEDVFAFIVKDSTEQKADCPAEIKVIESEIVGKYGIKAVNLCEMDVEFARELRDVAKYYYDNYPSARDKMTNFTLANVGDKSYMAAFMPIFTYITSNTSSSYPIGIKTQIILNSKYFLNNQKIQNSVSYGASSGYFPYGATRSSVVAHEFGHYLSYVALMNYHGVNNLTFVRTSGVSLLFSVYDDFNEGTFSYMIVQEAYRRSGESISFDMFRERISTYAMSKDENGNYIYDETIAEAFHDCYLNGDNANISSKLIVEVLMEYI